jgi:hypothetical protein
MMVAPQGISTVHSQLVKGRHMSEEASCGAHKCMSTAYVWGLHPLDELEPEPEPALALQPPVNAAAMSPDTKRRQDSRR